ncbi:MAG: Sm ribonucleo [Desulfurococcales archaeon ex4484_42]|nr:MAG: Sm ribonucleo [Desulfurococcales archaeon ex4484_42]
MLPARIESPLRTLRSAINRDVLVKIKDGNAYLGKLIMTDSTMNVVMVDCEELRGDSEEPIARYGTVLIRGSQILYIVINYSKKS